MHIKHLNSALLSVGVLSLVGVVMVFAYMKQVNSEAAVPASYEEAVIQRIRAQQAAQTDPLVTYIPEGLRGSDEVPEVSATDPVYGKQDAVVSIIAFADLECPSCADLDQLLRKKVDQSNGQVRLVWKDFPIPRIHKNSQDAAEAARCAQNQGKFWEYTEDLFSNQLLLGEDVYTAAAQEEGVDMAAFDTCRSGDEMLAVIQRDYLLGRSFQVEQTPTIYVGHHRLQGVISEEEVDAALDQAFGR
jgi:protein-disulfide isomerase